MPTEREEQERQARAEAKSFRSFLVPHPLSEGAMAALAALEAYATTSLADLDEWHKEMFRRVRGRTGGLLPAVFPAGPVARPGQDPGRRLGD